METILTSREAHNSLEKKETTIKTRLKIVRFLVRFAVGLTVTTTSLQETM